MINQTYARVRAFRLAFLITPVLLVIQYVLGMALSRMMLDKGSQSP